VIFEALQQAKINPRVLPVDPKKLQKKAKVQTFVTKTETTEEAAIDLLLRLGLPEVPEVGLSPVIKYRLFVGGVGIAYEGESESEGRRQFGMYMAESKTARLSSSGESVTLFRNFKVVRRYRPSE
jgi:hypothetical protein